jgi:hypothetical protein
MPEEPINYFKRIFQSTTNLSFIGVMLFLALVFSSGFLFLLLAGQLILMLFSQTGFVQDFIRNRIEREKQRLKQQEENRQVMALPERYRTDFEMIRQLCAEIERRAGELDKGRASSVLAEGLTEKLTSFRYEYLRMLRAHHLLANRNYKAIKQRLEAESKQVEASVAAEQSPQVRVTLAQNLKILQQRTAKVQQLDELVRLIEARLQVVRNSLQLIQDEVYSLTDVHGISTMVDSLLLNMELNEEYRSYYDDVLSDQTSMLSGLDTSMTLEPEFSQPKPEREREEQPEPRRRARVKE